MSEEAPIACGSSGDARRLAPTHDTPRARQGSGCAGHSVLPLALLILGACGYTFRGGEARAVHVEPITDFGADVDAAGLVASAVRRAVARGSGTVLSGRGEADALLEVELVESSSSLEPLADPSLRAAQYRAVVSVRGKLFDRRGRVVWTSGMITGDAPYLSQPGAIERLDGARRRALGRAAEDAAEKLIASMTWR